MKLAVAPLHMPFKSHPIRSLAMIIRNFFPVLSCVIFCFIGLSSLLAQEAKVAAHFSGGNGISAPDAFPGTGGQGWQDAWQVGIKNYEEFFTVDVTKENPFPDTPQSLKIQNKGAERKFSLSRLIDAGSLNTARPYVVTFKIRVDAFESAPTDLGFKIIGKKEGNSYGPSTSLWYLTTKNGRWFVVGKEGDEVTWKKTNIDVSLETIYTFTIRVNPEVGTYQVKINASGQEYESPEMLSVSPEATQGGNDIYFAAGAATDDRGGVFAWSLADIQITGSK